MPNINKSPNNFYSIFGLKLKSELREIYVSYIFLSLCTALPAFFVPIYLYENAGYGLKGVFIYFLLKWVGVIFLALPVGQFVAKKGPRLMIILSAFSYILVFISSALISNWPGFFWTMLVFDFFAITLSMIARDTNTTFQVRESGTGVKISIFYLIDYAIYILAPVVSGIIITLYGYSWLYGVTVFFAVIYFVMTFWLGEEHEDYTFSNKYLIKDLFSDFHKPLNLMNFFFGFRDLVVVAAWPVLLFLLIKNIESIGWFSSLSVLLLALFTFNLAKKIDKDPAKVKKYIKRGSLWEGLALLAKLAVFNFYYLFIADTINQIGYNLISVSLDKINYGDRNKFGTLVHHTLIRQMTYAIGVIVAAGFFLILAIFLPDILALKAGILILVLINIFSLQLVKRLDEKG
jgi:MFS family permease